MVNIQWGSVVLFCKEAHRANHLANYREGDGLASLVPSGHVVVRKISFHWDDSPF